jgi:hypothetical protein
VHVTEKHEYVATQENIVIIHAVRGFDAFIAELIDTMRGSVYAKENKEVMLRHAIKIKRELRKAVRDFFGTIK